MPIARIGGRAVSVKVLGWRTLKPADMTTQDTGGNSLWEWFAEFQPQEGQFYGFSNRRDRRAGVKFSIQKNTTSEINDNARIRLVVYYPDKETQKAIILDETYGTLKNATRDDIQTLITPTMTTIIKPGDWLRLECNYSEIVDVDQSSWEIGYLSMTR